MSTNQQLTSVKVDKDIFEYSKDFKNIFDSEDKILIIKRIQIIVKAYIKLYKVTNNNIK
jgi:hypothetical protein